MQGIRLSFRFVLMALGFIAFLAGQSLAAGQRVLFDASHAQSAGNADWTIDGGFSSFADALTQEGFVVAAHTRGELTAQELIQYAVVVLPEPNTAYTRKEQQAFLSFVEQGGGLFAIADHNGSDRNHDGIDSVGVFNQFLPQLGIQCELTRFNEAPAAGQYVAHPLTRGVTAIGMWAGCTLSLTQPTARALISLRNGKTYVACNELQGGGRVVAVGDSSPFDDGTGHPGHKLHDGWHQAGMQDAQLAVNAVTWLAHREAAPARVAIDPRAARRVSNFAVLAE